MKENVMFTKKIRGLPLITAKKIKKKTFPIDRQTILQRILDRLTDEKKYRVDAIQSGKSLPEKINCLSGIVAE